MFYHLIYPLYEYFSALNVLKYITFRTFLALFTSLFVFIIFGKSWIRFLQKKQMKQTIRTDGPQTHLGKQGTPTMGGVLLIIAVMASTLIWGNLLNPYLWVCIFVFLTMGLIGFIDDYKKVIQKNPQGFSGKYKIVLEVMICLIASLWMFGYLGLETTLYFPFFKEFTLDLSYLYLFFSILVIVGTANAVNLTDGLDGLVAVPSISSFFTYGLFIYIAGNKVISNYLQLTYVPFAGEVAVLIGAVVGACLGFLWFNAYPAEVFMGDVGSLSLGGLLGTVAIIAKQEILLILVGGLFVLETLSVMTQVISFKLTGKRVFRMAPIHHHFELKGWSEPKVIIRFWIISFILALLSMATLKIR